MRKTGWITAACGAVLSALLYLVRQTEWFAKQRAQSMSDFGELADSAFWAALITTLFGLVLLLLSLGRREEESLDNRRPEPLTESWVCPHCGAGNTQTDRRCRTCGTPRPQAPPSWFCAWCGTENSGTDNYCSACGRPLRNAAPDWLCAWCGTENPAGQETCSVCGNPRAEPTWTCPNCGTDNPLRQSACLVCNTRRRRRTGPVRRCPQCGGELMEWDRVCPRCGCEVEN